MRTGIFFLLFLTYFSLASQVAVKGTVYNSKGVLEGAAVYLNNSMMGTITDVNGEFSISVKEGQYELILSFLGYKKIKYDLNTNTYSKPLVFALEESDAILDEVTIKKTVYDDEWKYNLASFKKEFIGVTELAEDCKILNPTVLHFEYDAKKKIFTALARKPLQIKHKSLGYLITYELEHFVKNKNYITYLGYSRYKELKGSKRKKRLWKENRLKAYNGSNRHFLKSVLKNTFKEEGFVVNQFKRLPNPERPTEEEIIKARELLKLNKGIAISFNIQKKEPKTALDSAIVTLNKSRLPKFKDYLYKSKLKRDDIISFEDNTYSFSFNNNLSIVYLKEKEELGYIKKNIFSEKREPLPQTSSLIPLKRNSVIDIQGIMVHPLDIIYEGYWAYEKFANTLPLDYEPEN